MTVVGQVCDCNGADLCQYGGRTCFVIVVGIFPDERGWKKCISLRPEINDMVKALFFDIDGTLVSFRTHAIPDSAVDAVRTAKEKGIEIFISTGRPPLLISNIGQIERYVDGYVSTNGAYCYVGNEEIYLKTIPEKDVETLVNEGEKNGFTYLLVGLDEIAVFHPSDIYRDYFCELLNIDVVRTDCNPADFLRKPILQMTAFFDVDTEKKMMTCLPGSISSRWNPYFTDITASEADKGNGMLAMASRRGFLPEEVMAFGDGGNDIPIIKAAGTGIAMGDGNKSLKEVADYVTAPLDEDGVAYALRHYGII